MVPRVPGVVPRVLGVVPRVPQCTAIHGGGGTFLSPAPTTPTVLDPSTIPLHPYYPVDYPYYPVEYLKYPISFRRSVGCVLLPQVPPRFPGHI